jgi:hypothetical protein
MDNMVGKIKDIMDKDDNLHKNDYSEIEDIIFFTMGKDEYSA